MGAIKRFAEEVSVDMGLGGEINEEVLAEAQRRLDRRTKLDDYYCGCTGHETPHTGICAICHKRKPH